MTDAVTDATVLRLERTFAAPRQRVFDAWTDPEVLRRWWGAGPDWECPVADVDLRVGGRYRLTMRNPDGDEHTVGGEYQEIRPPERLVYTWAWEDMDAPASLVTVAFSEDAGRTTVVVAHSGLGTEGSRAQHEHGWNGCLANLERRVLAAG
jgi:uncharacterized protein YndB with AHSA1/START domain